MTPFAVFFLRQFFLGINAGVEEAARIDGAGHVRTFFRIVLPMSRGRSPRWPSSRTSRAGTTTSGRCWWARRRTSGC
ncbi:ABC transporter permease subunit [[Actinomadura] parvosata]|uniref:ABC transporter permease subunit n=1 Tax=[Actinomadura] parvosata TaxID=1955412 RepID=UPI003B96BFDE